MLYFFDPVKKEIDPVDSVDASAVGVWENDIEKALAHRPEALFKATRAGAPVLVVRTSARGPEMADVIALDAEGRLVLIECKRGSARRDTLAQLLDYASTYAADPFRHLQEDWGKGVGASSGGGLINTFQQFAQDPTADESSIGREQVLVVVAASQVEGFERIANFLKTHGVPVHFVPARLFRRGNGDLFLDVEPIDLNKRTGPEDEKNTRPVWLINTNESHSSGAHERFIALGVAAIWGYDDGPATLQQGAKVGDKIYAYLNQVGIVAAGTVRDDEIRRASADKTAFPGASDPENEWHLGVDWKALPKPIPVAEVRSATGAGLPVRNTFCRLWNPKVQAFLEKRTR